MPESVEFKDFPLTILGKNGLEHLAIEYFLKRLDRDKFFAEILSCCKKIKESSLRDNNYNQIAQKLEELLKKYFYRKAPSSTITTNKVLTFSEKKYLIIMLTKVQDFYPGEELNLGFDNTK